MNQPAEPYLKKSSCAYCGDAPINHTRSFFESMVSGAFDNYAKIFLPYVPSPIKRFADAVPEFLFRTLVFFNLAEFSSDINKANNFRSRIIWEEAAKRGIHMEQIIFLGKPLDHYRATLKVKKNNKAKERKFYFESIPVPPEFLDANRNWDDKVTLKRELGKHGIPIPAYFEFPFFAFSENYKEKIFSKLKKPIIVKPRVGSRGRHTVTNINNLEQFKEGINIAGEICSRLVVEEHLHGSVCRATLVSGVLAGFYRGDAPVLIGDGEKTIIELIHEKDEKRHSRVERVNISKELHDHISRSGFKINDVLPKGVTLPLSHRVGRLFGGRTVEMLEGLHPSFIPVLEKAAKIVGLAVVGFDCIVPDPTKDQGSQRWGIIECNTLPFIDLHYYALEGKPKNIAGMIWDLWQ
jgi:cyanophycin synthetase